MARRAAAPRHGAACSTAISSLFLAAATLIQSSHAVYYAFGTLYWQRLGYSDAVIAWLWAEGAIAEVVLFYFGAGLVRRCGPLMLMALGGRAAARALGRDRLRHVAAGLRRAAAAPRLELRRGASRARCIFSTRRVPPERAATAQSLYAATVNGIGFGLAHARRGRALWRVRRRRLSRHGGDGRAGAALAAGLGRRARYLS